MLAMNIVTCLKEILKYALSSYAPLFSLLLCGPIQFSFPILFLVLGVFLKDNQSGGLWVIFRSLEILL